MKHKTLDRMNNFHGNRRPDMVQRIQVCSATVDDKGNVKQGPLSTGLVQVSMKKLRIEKAL